MVLKRMLTIVAVLAMISCQKDEIEVNKDVNIDQEKVEYAIENLNGKPVTIEYLGRKANVIDIGDHYVFEGDILINKEKYHSKQNTLKGAAINGNRWNYQYNRIAYVVNSSLPDKQRVTDAINHIEANTNIDFVTRTTQPDYIEIVHSDNGTYSTDIGKGGGRQEIGLASWATMGNTVHELLHALGVFHEHTRQDRNDHIIVNWQHIGTNPNTIYQYQIYTNNYSGFDHGNFDFNSIMLYPSIWNSNTSGWSMTDLNNNPFTAQRTGLSAGDIALLNELYPPIPPIIELKVVKYNNYSNSYRFTYGFTTKYTPTPVEVIEWYGSSGSNNTFYNLHSTNSQCDLILMKQENGGYNYHYMRVKIRDAEGQIHTRTALCHTPEKCFIMALMPPPDDGGLF
ncbi:astacin (peptidase family M12A) [Ancylomarina subtilis]|uniref:Astacin (Peptidase family M12A) n=2 Tax=Ancylomarina subtilis TaxID=1639035 RepID=A0A4Q7VHU1_9BACT|nr:astacin (peptidase family M12A) [Ancylomarina subtilis]